MSYTGRSGGVLPGDVVRVAGAGLMAGALGGWIMVCVLAQPLEKPVGMAFGAIVLTALMAALSYRHVGAMVSAGAVLAGLGIVQLVTLQGDLLREDQLRDYHFALESSVLLLSLGCILLGAGAGWALARSVGQPRWSHYSALQIVGALALGALAGGFLVWSAEQLYVSDDLVSWGVVPLISGAALAFGVVPALSPTGMLPAVVALGAMAFLSEDPFWGSPTMVTAVVLLAVPVHFVGPMGTREDGGRYGAEHWNAWLGRDQHDGGEAERSH